MTPAPIPCHTPAQSLSISATALRLLGHPFHADLSRMAADAASMGEDGHLYRHWADQARVMVSTAAARTMETMP